MKTGQISKDSCPAAAPTDRYSHNQVHLPFCSKHGNTSSNRTRAEVAGGGHFLEKENIYTLDSKGDLLITIMSSLAQKESRSISENVT
jgi:hypothetical protein